MFRIYKEELSSIFLKFLKLYLVRYCINKICRLCYGSYQFDLFGSNNDLGLRQTIVVLKSKAAVTIRRRYIF
jgi:hypothetical protein